MVGAGLQRTVLVAPARAEELLKCPVRGASAEKNSDSGGREIPYRQKGGQGPVRI